MYACMLFVSWMLFIIIGGVLSSAALGSPKYIQSFCDDVGNYNNDTPTKKEEHLQFVIERIKDIDEELIGTMNKFMCSVACPCDKDGVNAWTDTMTEQEMNKFGRTLEEPTSELPYMTKDGENYYYWVADRAFDDNPKPIYNYE